MKNFIEKHPFWFSLLFTILIMQALGLVVVIVGARILGLPELPVRVVAAAATTVVPLLFIWRLGWWKDAGLVNTTQNVYALAIPLILTLFPIVFFGVATMAPQRVVVFILAVAFTGISEEVYIAAYTSGHFCRTASGRRSSSRPCFSVRHTSFNHWAVGCHCRKT